MQRLIVFLTKEQQSAIVEFFLTNPQYQQIEHYLHTHSPLDNLEHYMWEELHEPNHNIILKNYQKYGYLVNKDINLWIEQEINEHTRS